jgi:hypothetical protein
MKATLPLLLLFVGCAIGRRDEPIAGGSKANAVLEQKPSILQERLASLPRFGASRTTYSSGSVVVPPAPSKPVVLRVIVESFEPPHGGATVYCVNVRVLERDGVSRLKIAVADITSDAEPFLQAGTSWRIQADERHFEEQRTLGCCIAELSQMRPERI